MKRSEAQRIQLVQPRAALSLPSTAAGSVQLIPRESEPMPFWRSELIGRSSERANLAALLIRSETGLVTLTGPGGVGKTRLALQMAQDLAQDFPDGIIFVPLAALNEASLVPVAIANALGVSGLQDELLNKACVQAVLDRKILLILDNFEHLLVASTFVTQLIHASAMLVVLVTSRAPLNVRGEQQVVLGPLALPAPDGECCVERALEAPAVALFVRRAQEKMMSFKLTSANVGAVVDICRRLDGLPLALELAAARIKLLPPESLRERLNRRLWILTNGARDVPVRQRTLRATLAWSYDLLHVTEQTLFRRLAAFDGGCTQATAEAVCADADWSHDVVLNALGSLIDHHLLRRVEASDGEPRFCMSETIREYACEQLVESAEAELVQAQHAAFFLAFTDEAEQHIRAGQEAPWLMRLDAESENLRAALDWLIAHSRATDAVRLAANLWYYWLIGGRYTEGRQYLGVALQLHIDAQASDPSRIRALFGAAWLATHQGDYDAALSWYVLLQQSCQASGEPSSTAYAAIGRGQSYALRGNEAAAQRQLLVALEVASVSGDHWVTGLIQMLLATCLMRQGHIEAAENIFHQSMCRWSVDNRVGLAASLSGLAQLALLRGDVATAKNLALHSLDLSGKAHKPANLFSQLRVLGAVALAEHDFAAAVDYFQQVVGTSNEVGHNEGLGRAAEGLAIAATQTGRTEQALILFGAATTHHDLFGPPVLADWAARVAAGVSEASANLGLPAAHALLGRGASMHAEDLVTYALSDCWSPSSPTACEGTFVPPSSSVTGRSTEPTADSSGPFADRASRLTPRELDVLRHVVIGKTNRQIAGVLVLSENTVARHLANIFNKLEVSSRAAATAFAIRAGIG